MYNIYNKEYIYTILRIFVIFFEIFEIISTIYKQNYIKNGKREC